MHYGPAEAAEFTNSLRINILDTHGVSVILCPPFLALSVVSEAVKGSDIKVGAQRQHDKQVNFIRGQRGARQLAR